VQPDHRSRVVESVGPADHVCRAAFASRLRIRSASLAPRPSAGPTAASTDRQTTPGPQKNRNRPSAAGAFVIGTVGRPTLFRAGLGNPPSAFCTARKPHGYAIGTVRAWAVPLDVQTGWFFAPAASAAGLACRHRRESPQARNRRNPVHRDERSGHRARVPAPALARAWAFRSGPDGG
jgi:hypothetical protein